MGMGEEQSISTGEVGVLPVNGSPCRVCLANGVTGDDLPVTTFQYVRIKNDVPEEAHRFVGLGHTPEEIQAAAEGMMGPLTLLWHAPQRIQVGVDRFHPDGLTGLLRFTVEAPDQIADGLRAAHWPTG